VNTTSSTPVLVAMEGFQFVGIFVQSIFANIVFILTLLSIMLIYSLMVADVDAKTYEMGMLRALGLKWMSICYINSIQSFIFSIPGILFGLLISSFLNVIVVYIIYQYSYARISYLITQNPAILGTCLGIFIPVFSNILPIQKALSKTIRDSLDIYHHQASDLTIKITKLSSNWFSPFQLMLGFVLITAGVITYYILPASFLF